MSVLWKNIFRNKIQEDSLAHFLSTIPVFAELGRRELAFLEKLVHIRRYGRTETVFEEGDAGSGMYMIRSGRVLIFTRGIDGREEELALLGPGDFFGEITLVAPSGRTASARTLEASELVGLFRADLLETAEKHPDIANRILLGLARTVGERLQAYTKECQSRKTENEKRLPAASEEI